MKENKNQYAVIRAVMIQTNTGSFKYIPLELGITCYDNGKETEEYSTLIRLGEQEILPPGLPAYLNEGTLQNAPDMIDVLQKVADLIKNKTLICKDASKLEDFLEKALGQKIPNEICEKLPEYA